MWIITRTPLSNTSKAKSAAALLTLSVVETIIQIKPLSTNIITIAVLK
ncbi:MAG TPA: hypothetical protein VEK08_09025 [Planctomycetota bacterium]|nr:hypothetical protein [Planctomycetota bacterium]